MKKFITAFLASIIIFTSQTFADVHQYEDVPSWSEYFYSIDYLRRNDVFKNTKLFNPDIIISRAEFIKYLVLLNNSDFRTKAYSDLPFEDTMNNAWYASYFEEAIKLGILSDRDPKANPYNKLTLTDALQLLFHSQGIPIPRIHEGAIPYTDVERNKYYAPLVMMALGFDLFTPQRSDYAGIYRRITRAESARIIYKMDIASVSYTAPQSNISSFDLQLQKIISTWELIYSGYIHHEEIAKIELSDAAINAMVEVLDDPYSAYLDPGKNAAFSDDMDGEIEGIGAYIAADDDGAITIIAPIKDSPAERAGIKPGDIVIKVDGTDITEMILYEAVNLIKGPRGTTVKLTIKRNGLIKTIEVTRDVVKISSLEYEVIENGRIMLIKIAQFNQNTPAEFQEATEIIQNNPAIKGVIIDVRDNPGGLLDSVVRIMNFMLLPDSEIVTIEYSYFSYTQYARGNGELADYPMVVLINEGSASASEILAGALKDYDFAKIIGETSFGKGSVQEMNYFIDSSSLKLTVAKWLTPLNHDIDKHGIAPNIIVSDNPNTETDEQMNRGLSELNKMIQ